MQHTIVVHESNRVGSHDWYSVGPGLLTQMKMNLFVAHRTGDGNHPIQPLFYSGTVEIDIPSTQLDETSRRHD